MTKAASKRVGRKNDKGKAVKDSGGKTTIRKLPPDILKAVKAEAERTHRSVDGMIHEIVSQFVKAKQAG